MNMKYVTLTIMIVTAVLLVLWDIYVAAKGPTGSTISEVMLYEALRHPIIPFALGILCGHFFWSQAGN